MGKAAHINGTEAAGLAALRLLGAPFMRGGSGGRLSVLIYHRVLPAPDPLLPGEPDAERFEQHMALLSGQFNVLPLVEAVQRLQSGRLPARAACVTFDDGYADNEEVALPILRRWNVPATFFVSTGFLEGGCMWNDVVIEAVRSCSLPELDLDSLGLGRHQLHDSGQRSTLVPLLLEKLKYLDQGRRDDAVRRVATAAGVAVPDTLMMKHGQVRKLAAAGMEIGGHTVSHPILSGLDDELARNEIAQGREELSAITGDPVRLFAYPNGRPGRDYEHRHVEIVRKLGFDAAVSTSWGAARRGSDRFQLPRFTPWDRSPVRFAARLVQNRLMYRTSVV